MKKLLFLLLAMPVFADTGWLFQPLYTQGQNNPSQTVTAGHVGTLYFNNSQSPSQVYIKTDDYPSTNWVPITNYATPYMVTCTANSATATNIVSCLPAASVAAGQVALVQGIHAQVNGSTNWNSTATSCTLQDSTNAVPFISITGLSANVYYSGTSTNATRSPAYYLGQGATPGAGLNLTCSANGTGSPLVMTVFGVIQN